MSSDKKTSRQDKENHELNELREKLKSIDLTQEQRQFIESMLEKEEGEEDPGESK